MPPARPDHTVKTYRYLRLGMLLVLVALLVSVAIERTRAPGCWQESLSGYYYTPVQTVFVGSLAALGLGMVVLYGNTRLEDVLLNLGGMLAPLVAVVPTTDASGCSSAPEPADPETLLAGAGDEIHNNVTTLAVLGALTLGVVLGSALRTRREAPWRTPAKVGFTVAAGVLVAGTGWYAVGRESFVDHAHFSAAALLFVLIAGVVAANGRDRASSHRATSARRRAANRYWLLFAVMSVSALVIGAIAVVTGWRYWLLALETDLLVVFATFWLLQTAELWRTGSRPGRAAAG